MALQFTGKNLDVGKALRAYIAERIDQTLDKYIGKSIGGHVRIEKEHGEFRTDCSIQLRSGLNIQSHGEAADAYASADLALDRLDKRLRRYKRRLKRRHGQASPPQTETQAPYYIIQQGADEEEAPEEDNPVIIAETRTAIREMAVSDAVMELDLSEEPFLVFRNASHGRVNVVYRRRDGNIGWIDPDGTSSPAE